MENYKLSLLQEIIILITVIVAAIVTVINYHHCRYNILLYEAQSPNHHDKIPCRTIPLQHHNDLPRPRSIQPLPSTEASSNGASLGEVTDKVVTVVE